MKKINKLPTIRLPYVGGRKKIVILIDNLTVRPTILSLFHINHKTPTDRQSESQVGTHFPN